MRNRRLTLLLGLLLSGPIAAEQLAEQPTTRPAPPAADAERSVPGQLDVVSMTAIELDGRLEDGVDPQSFGWKIVEGTGGKLFGTDQPSAVFLAPKVERGVEEFIVELQVTYAKQPPSTRSVRIRVVPTDPAAAEDGDGGGTGWLDDFYREAKEIEKSKKKNAPTIVLPANTGPQVTMGVGFGGFYGGRVGYRWSMGYPLSQPVVVPPPGQTYRPGEGAWTAPRPVPYEELDETFPPDIADRYRVIEDPDDGDDADEGEKTDPDPEEQP